MKSTQGKDLRIAYIGGGSRAWAWTFMTDLALEDELSGEIRLYDIDCSAAKNNEIIGNGITAMPGAKGSWRYTAVPTLSEALEGVDFVIISILPGTFAEMRSDVHLPERLGIYQSVGDTAGPGGMIRALRTIPVFVEFAKAISQYAPDAWVINYTNPMSLCVRSLYHGFPQIKAIGCCHEVFGMQSLLASVVGKETGLASISRTEIQVNVLGLNHFTWFSQASYKNYDLFDLYARFVETFFDTGFEHESEKLPDKCFTCRHRVKFDLFRRYGWMAAAGDRHLAEFMPSGTYLRDPATAESWGFYLTSVDWREKDLARRLSRSDDLVSGRESVRLSPSGEEGILLIKALCGLTRVVSNVNIVNEAGQIPNLPRETVVETNALFTYNNVRPIAAGALSGGVYALTLPHVENQSDILHAALECDREAVYRAFARDPLTANRCSDKDLRALADDMISATAKYLPKDWVK